MVSTFSFPLRILFGDGAISELPAELASLDVRRPLIVTDPGIVAAGLLDRALHEMARGSGHRSAVFVFAEVQANPHERDVLNALNLYRENRCDGLIGLGGGSPIDAAKATRLLVTHAGRLADYDVSTGGTARIRADLPPMIAVPTTAGTGSEAGRGALIQLPQTGRKTAILSPHLLPSVALCDPELTRELPPVLTAGTGMDALTHCIESFLSTTYHPICDGIALEGLRQVARGLEPSVQDGSQRDARRSLMMGALLGGVSFHKGLGVIHSLSHALGSDGRAHHGTLNAVLLPHALRFNFEAAQTRLADLAAQLGLGRSGDGPGHLITLAEILLARLPLPRRLGEIDGLDRRRIPEYARLAMLDHCHRTNPRPCDESSLIGLLEAAW
ncbi:iron-containing alcohol dehydrogenase [Tautonia sp. JC769]|uniref:iron-containing alcohol dehydrogenase n=1 Tax=Tautonia sp. JC769 TaxID=3232135 RepID=UPI003457486C